MPTRLAPLSVFRQLADFAVIWLNGSESAYSKSWERIWNGSKYRYCTDGAANSIMKRRGTENLELPHKITGDFDSIDPEVRNGLEGKATVIETADQDKTDMTKCMEILNEDARNNGTKSAIILGGFSGRFDHTLASLNSLLSTGVPSGIQYYAIDDVNLVCVLSEGDYIINIDRNLITGTCGLIPFCQKKTIVTTKGLKWNVEDCSLEFGGIISTSNIIENDDVTINTSSPLIFTMELKRGTVDE